MLAVWTLLAEGDAAPKTAPPGFDLLPLVLIGVAFLFFVILPMRRDRRQRAEMLATIDKGDRVVVNGAIVGTVIQVAKADEPGGEDQLLVKIDENANVKLRVLRSGITRVMKDKKDSKDGA
jgi:preprotein translocase subunit YajC